MCHGYKQANPNWCCQCCYPGEKSGSLVSNIWSFTVAATKKRAKRSNLRICRDSWSFTCSSKTVHYHTELARYWVFGSQDARFQVFMLLSADTV